MMNPLQRQERPAPFSLDRRDHARRRGMQRKEWRLLVILPLLVVVMAVVIQALLRLREALPTGPGEPVIAELVLHPMPAPRLGDSPALPEEAAIAAATPVVADLMASRATVRHDQTLDAGTLAWARLLMSQDRTAPPLPSFADAHDLVLGNPSAGSPLAVEGRLLDARVDGGFLHLVVGLDEEQYLLVMTDPAERVVVGRNVRLTGRYLGTVNLPAGTTGDATFPLMTASTITARTATQDEDGLAPFRTGFPTNVPADLYAGVSDERNALERTPYYTLLGLAKADRSIEGEDSEAGQGNTTADAIHRDPEAHRGRRYHVMGRVYRAWEDPQVARDKPYGIERVVRILMWNRDIGQVTEIEDGKTRFKTQILRLYELCLVTDQPLPQRGEQLVATGRFFKFRAIPVERDRMRDAANGITRQSDKVYPFTFVGGPFTITPPAPVYEFSWVSAVGSLVAVTMVVFLLWAVRRDAHLQARVPNQIRSLRATRRALTPVPPSTTPPCSPPPSA